MPDPVTAPTPDDLARAWADGCSEALRVIVGQAFRAGFAAAVERAAKVAEDWSVEIPDQTTYDGTGVHTVVDGSEVAEQIRKLAG